MFRTDMEKLRTKMSEKGKNQEDLARMIGVDPSTFSRKMKTNGMKFTIGEAHKLADALDMSADEATQIFLQ